MDSILTFVQTNLTAIIIGLASLISFLIGLFLEKPGKSKPKKPNNTASDTNISQKPPEHAITPTTKPITATPAPHSQPQIPPRPPTPVLSPAERKQELLQLRSSYPDIGIVLDNLDEFKRMLQQDVLLAPETFPTQAILVAKRVNDFLLKHKDIILGETSDIPSKKSFIAILNLVVKRSSKV